MTKMVSVMCNLVYQIRYIHLHVYEYKTVSERSTQNIVITSVPLFLSTLKEER
jgi:hypothetical protein